jgi:predicted phosphodiesterase
MFNILKKQESRVLVIGDLHCPFEKEGYLEFCKEQYKKWKCNQVVFIGDIIDNHYSSYHDPRSCLME